MPVLPQISFSTYRRLFLTRSLSGILYRYGTLAKQACQRIFKQLLLFYIF